MSRLSFRVATATVACLSAGNAIAQTATKPLPDVEVIQKSAKPAKVVKKKASAPSAPTQQQVSPPIQEEPIAENKTVLENTPYGATNSQGAAARAAKGSLSPISAKQALPDDLQNYTSAGSRVTGEDLQEQRPLTTHEALARVPGVVTVNDDGFGRHSGIGVRGSPTRRSRKVLIMEDGQPINFSTILDPSTHYTPPVERLESIEVMRGTVLNYGPLTNHGAINFRNLSPFGADETVIKAGIGYTEGADQDVNNFRHVHTRQTLGNVGIVASYSGAEGGGAWDNEVLRFNDFYGALGFKGSNQDLTISGGYFRQRDNYDEYNFAAGNDAAFFANGRSKSASPFFVGDSNLSDLNTYNADYFRLQVAHNLYIDDTTTLSTRVYGGDHERNRFAGRRWSNTAGVAGNGYMRGRERDYENYGAETRLELADRPFIAGMRQDIQAGVRYEYHEMVTCNTVGLKNQVLDNDTKGNCNVTNAVGAGAFAAVAPLTPGVYRENSRRTEAEADAFSAFVQSAVHVTSTLTVTPGLRFESYDIVRNSINPDPDTGEQAGRTTSNHDNVLPGISFAWEALPLTTVYGGYHQAVTPQVTRGPAFPLQDERGDNYQIGLRSKAVRGLTFDAAYFHNVIENYQVKDARSTGGGNNVFGTVGEVEIQGVELYSRLDSQAFTGGPFNWFGEAVYTLADSEITRSTNAREIGNPVPESPRHFANLTLGMEHASGFDASVTYTFRGEFFTDTFGTVAGANASLGSVDSVWLLSARANYRIPSTNATLFVSGQNLADEFYIADRADGAKPGIGRTIMGGFTLRFE